MKRLLILHLRLYLLFALCIGVARMIGQRQPLDPGLAKLHLTDCAPPCWLGIVPGKSILADVRPIIRAAYPESDYVLDFSTWDLDGTSNSIEARITPRNSTLTMRVSLGARVNDPVIRDITIFPENTATPVDPPTISDLYFAFGTPQQFVDQPWIVDGPALRYGDSEQGVMLNLFDFGQPPAYHVLWSTPIRVVRMYGVGHYRVPAGILKPDEVKETRWHGFTWY